MKLRGAICCALAVLAGVGATGCKDGRERQAEQSPSPAVIAQEEKGAISPVPPPKAEKNDPVRVQEERTPPSNRVDRAPSRRSEQRSGSTSARDERREDEEEAAPPSTELENKHLTLGTIPISRISEDEYGSASEEIPLFKKSPPAPGKTKNDPVQVTEEPEVTLPPDSPAGKKGGVPHPAAKRNHERNTMVERPAPPKPSLPPRKPASKARLALIIDDVGMSTRQLQPFLDIPAELTFAILPETRASRQCLSLIRAKGRLPLLHLPMEPYHRKDLLPPGAITLDLTSEEIRRRVEKHLAELRGVRGVNNHMGSKATQDSRVMENVLDVVRKRGLFFVDSKTSDETVVSRIATQVGVPHATRTGEFLDDGGNTARAYEIVLNLGREAQRNGTAIGIGHPHAGTARAIARALPELEAMGVRIVPVSELTR